MKLPRGLLCLVFILVSSLADLPAEERRPLLNVSAGQIPNDTAQEGKTKFALQAHPVLGPKVLKVAFATGDTFGMKGGRENNWLPFETLSFQVFNPAEKEVVLTFTIRQRTSTNFNTRIDRPLSLKAGANRIELKLRELKNNNGSAPDLSEITHWYLACASDEGPTLYFTDFLLLGTGTSLPKSEPKTDPARLARIRAAKMPGITKPVLFNTPTADEILAALEVFPPDHPLNQLVDSWPVHPNSKNIVASVGVDKPLRYNPDMAFILVPPDQAKVAVKLVGYPGESDPGPYPVPANTPIEGWPVGYEQANGKVPTLEEVQRRPPKYEGDRHALIVDPIQRKLYEFFVMGKSDGNWAADQASIFDLSSNKLRPDGWTSADAAGLPIFPLVVRHDELKRGSIDHALRVTIRKSRRAYVYPATHFASRLDDVNLPRMGERFRLRADYPLAGFSPEVQAILTALKRYGMLVADNGIEWAISVTPDERIPNLHAELRKIKGADFEVVVAPE